MPTDKRTPTPWYYEFNDEQGPRGGDRSSLFLFFSHSYGVKFVSLPPTLEMKANAAFIVEACNSHDALVAENARLREALNNVLASISICLMPVTGPGVADNETILKITADGIRTALANKDKEPTDG